MCYESKKRNAKERGIEFLLTKEEYDFFMLLREDRDVRCAYTDQPFIFKKEHGQYPTLERLLDRGPYSLNNCVLVCRLANQVKDAYIDKGVPVKEDLKPHLVGVVRKLKHKCAQPDWLENCWKEQVGSRLHLLKSAQTTKSSEEVMPEVSTSGVVEQDKPTFYRNPDLDLATSYAQLGAALVGAPVEFVLSFTDYKMLMNKKTCQLTGIPFTDTDVKSLYFKDKTKAISKENCFVTTKIIQESLDKMFVSVKLSPKQLQKMFKTLGE